ncbi:hypothetical protein [Virgibacillus halodenitrificans]|uniref:Uncharacterized protein n=1 Tax=Virgibacillus halodenitrificans TaxID=1482 RepID=A0ABR7VL38_VIRHA|nr:hypothetical protein [Virgibacillus halodenitrificans]MBD1222639.1 hypothetical protein [Virgibacillus halodenitrificans]MCG1028276.1 hypothetical protein [Virgibacillus halodenitrificans]
MDSNQSKDQAAELRKLVTDDEKSIDIAEEGNIEDDETTKIDLLNLPPRKQVHTTKKSTKVKVSSAFIRFIIVFLALTFLVLIAYYLWY